MSGLKIRDFGSEALLVEFEQKIDLKINQSVHLLNKYILRQVTHGVIQTLPAYCSLVIRYDKNLLSSQELSRVILDFDFQPPLESEKKKIFRIPVCYDSYYGLDLEEVEEHTGLSLSEIIKKHTAPVYDVFMMGFLPGFAYLGKTDETIYIPRKSIPRTKVPGGAVGLAGNQTGVYPFDAPGGWQIIGRTPIPMITATDHLLLRAGDQVRFFSVSPKDYECIRHDISSGNFNFVSLHVW